MESHDSGGEDGSQILLIPDLIVRSNLAKKINDKLVSPFNAMTMFFFRRSVEKAFQLDEQPSGLSLNPHKPLNSNPPHITSAIDDIMYIVNKVLQQSLATSQRTVVADVIPTLARVLGSDFIGMEQRKMRDESYPKAAVHGALPPESTIVAFLVLINNLDVAADYIKRIVSTQLESTPSNDGEAESQRPLSHLYPLNHDAVFVVNALKSFGSSVEGKATELIADGVQVTFNNVMKPRLRPIVADAFRDVDYQMTEDELADVGRENGAGEEEEDLVRRRFQHGWDALTKPIARILTERNFDKLLTLVVSYLSKVIEKRIWSYYGRVNELGAVRLERDITALIGTIVQGKRYQFREAFTKCSEICLVLNMEDDEWEELSRQPGECSLLTRLTLEEQQRARSILKDTP